MTNFKTKTGAWAKKAITVLTVFIFLGMTFFTACQNVLDSGEGVTTALSARSVRGVGQPTPITNQDDLAAIELDPSGEYIIANDFDVDDWTPICDPAGAGAFTGSLDGNGMTITINSFDSTYTGNYLGIFAVVGDGTATPLIENLTVNFATSAFSTTAQYVGGIAAYAQNAVFDTNVVNGTLNVSYTGTNPVSFDVGGIVGYASGGTFNANNAIGLDFIVTSASVSSGTVTASSNIGGIVGYAQYASFIGGSVDGKSGITSNDASSSNVGGMVGYTTGSTFNNIFVSGLLGIAINSSGSANSTAGVAVGYAANTTFDTVTAKASFDPSYTSANTNSFETGGVVGDAEKVIFVNVTVVGSIYATANMPLTTDYTAYNFLATGGVAGYANGGSIDIASSAATVNGSSTLTESHTGGLVGRANSFAITDDIGAGPVTSAGKNSNTSAGGVAGYITTSTVTNSYTTAGDITVSAPSGSGTYDVYQAFAGGLVGYSGNSSTITFSHTTGQTVTANNSAFPYAGGLVGNNYGLQSYPNPPSSGSAIIRSYSTNTVIATADKTNGIPYAGGLAGYNSAAGSVIEDCYAWGNVTATTGGPDAWAGGVSGAVAAGATLNRTYATGTVTATAGSGSLPYPQTGIDNVAAAGGVVGYAYNYYVALKTTVENSVGLNDTVTAQGSSVANEAHRVVGHNGPTLATITNNLGSTAMSLTPPPATLDPDLDGGNTAATPAQSVFAGLGWNFNTVWVMGSAYPVLQ